MNFGSLTGLVAIRVGIRREKRMVMRESELQLAISYYLLEREREREREKQI